MFIPSHLALLGKCTLKGHRETCYGYLPIYLWSALTNIQVSYYIFLSLFEIFSSTQLHWLYLQWNLWLFSLIRFTIFVPLSIFSLVMSHMVSTWDNKPDPCEHHVSWLPICQARILPAGLWLLSKCYQVINIKKSLFEPVQTIRN